MTDFIELLRKLLMSEEYNKTEEEADRLIKSYPNIIMQGMMEKNLNATAMALEIKDAQQPD